MKILLLNVDSRLPNIALKKIEMWHNQQGDEVIWDIPMMLGQTDKAYASCIFTENSEAVANYKGLYSELIAGGTGYDLTIKLPTEIEMMKPKINYGFTTRGCIRKCSFCIVPKSEGNIRVVGDIYDVWDGKSKILTLLDNNILAVPDHFAMICRQIMKEKIIIDFNQALDIRLVDGWIAYWISSLRHQRQIGFSFDSLKIEGAFRMGMKYLGRAGIRMSKIMVFLLVGFNSTFDEDLERIEIIKEYGASPFVMKYREVNGVKPLVERDKNELRELARWVNQPHGFYKVMSFAEWQGIEIEEKYCEIAAKRCSQSVMSLDIEIKSKEEKQHELV